VLDAPAGKRLAATRFLSEIVERLRGSGEACRDERGHHALRLCEADVLGIHVVRHGSVQFPGIREKSVGGCVGTPRPISG
jgi:hypothetical protein